MSESHWQQTQLVSTTTDGSLSGIFWCFMNMVLTLCSRTQTRVYKNPPIHFIGEDLSVEKCSEILWHTVWVVTPLCIPCQIVCVALVYKLSRVTSLFAFCVRPVCLFDLGFLHVPCLLCLPDLACHFVDHWLPPPGLKTLFYWTWYLGLDSPFCIWIHTHQPISVQYRACFLCSVGCM